MDHVFDKLQWNIHSVIDFRVVGRQQFQGLRSLCQLAEESIQTSLVQFYSNSYVNALTTSSELLLSQLNATIEQFISSTTNNFLLSLRKISNTTQANALLSGRMTNFSFTFQRKHICAYSNPNSYDDNCSCSYAGACITQSRIYYSLYSLAGWPCSRFLHWLLHLRSPSSVSSRMSLQCDLFKSDAVLSAVYRIHWSDATRSFIIKTIHSNRHRSEWSLMHWWWKNGIGVLVMMIIIMCVNQKSAVTQWMLEKMQLVLWLCCLVWLVDLWQHWN